MIPQWRAHFLANYQPARHQQVLTQLQAQAGPIPFPVAEGPCFLPRKLVAEMELAGRQLLEQLATPAYREASEETIPPHFRVPAEPARPMFAQVDFGLLENEAGQVQPKLVEIQGFPSLYAFQPALCQTFQEIYGLQGLHYHPLDETPAQYWAQLRRAIVGDADPQEVVLLEIDPQRQKTRPDFVLTERRLGVRPVCLSQVVQRGNRLFAVDGPVERPIRRIYNRVIVDELERKGLHAPFAWNEPLDVEWAGHPNHYFRISKFSLLHLQHATVPKSYLLSAWLAMPENERPPLTAMVLKPLYSFAGQGVQIHPTESDVAAVQRPAEWILQQRCNFAALFPTPAGAAKAELRMMYLDLGTGPRAIGMICRMGRGEMMGVNQNSAGGFVGAAAAFWPAGEATDTA